MPRSEYMCTKFGVDSSSCFSFGVQTHAQTGSQSHICYPTDASATASIGNF